MLHLYILIGLNVFLIGVYYFARSRDNKRLVKFAQPSAVIISWIIASSSLFRPHPDIALTIVILIGMGIAIIGDFLNIDMSNMSVVLRGLVIAVFAYLTYAIGFTYLAGFHYQDLIVGILLLIVYALLMQTIWPGVEEGMRIPVLIYGLVLPFTFSRSVSTIFSSRFSTGSALFLSLGIFCLFVGDIEFAIDTFKKRLPFMLGPILYAGG